MWIIVAISGAVSVCLAAWLLWRSQRDWQAVLTSRTDYSLSNAELTEIENTALADLQRAYPDDAARIAQEQAALRHLQTERR